MRLILFGRLTPIHSGEECTCFGSTYTKIETIQRRLAWSLRKDDTQNREAFHIFCPGPCHRYHSIVIGSNNHVVYFAGMRVRRLNSFLYGHIWHYFCVPDFQVQNGCMELLWFSLSHFSQTLSKRPSLNSLITLLKRCVSQMQPKHCKLSCWPMKAPKEKTWHIGDYMGLCFGRAPHIFQIKYSANMSNKVELLEIWWRTTT